MQFSLTTFQYKYYKGESKKIPHTHIARHTQKGTDAEANIHLMIMSDGKIFTTFTFSLSLSGQRN